MVLHGEAQKHSETKISQTDIKHIQKSKSPFIVDNPENIQLAA